jgi:RNA polymerase sigma-70 factor (ECF subfamily)
VRSQTLKIDNRFIPSGRSFAVVEHSELSVLISDCIAGSRNAQQKMYDLYTPAAYGVIRRYLHNNEQLAQEILNDSFLKVLTKLNQYNFQGAFEGWIRRIVVNTVTDHLRKNIKDEHHKEIQPEDAWVPCNSVTNLSHKELLQLVQELPDAQRTVFNLFVFEKYSHKEIAEILNINENNSRWHLNDARRRLKEKINSVMK